MNTKLMYLQFHGVMEKRQGVRSSGIDNEPDDINKKDKMAAMMAENMAAKWKMIRNRNNYDEPANVLSEHIRHLMSLISDCKLSFDVQPYIKFVGWCFL